MSEIMLGVLRMPDDLFWADDPITRMQHNCIRKEAAEEIERLQAECERLVEVLELMVTTHDEGGGPSATIAIAQAALAARQQGGAE